MAQDHPLSKREAQVVAQLLQGKSNKLIAVSLDISERTVEFHLKNIYAKFQVSSRIELILKLRNTTGDANLQKLGHSTVDRLAENTENTDRRNPKMDWAASFKDAVSQIGKELQMKNLLNSMHIPAGVGAALLTGFGWVVMFRYAVNMSMNDIQTWIVPSMVIWAMIGLFVGLLAKRIGNSPLKVWFTTMLGTGFSPITILPLMGFVALPVGKFLEWLGLIDRATISNDAAEILAITAMLMIWLVVGTTLGSMLLFVAIKKPDQKIFQTPVPEHRT